MRKLKFRVWDGNNLTNVKYGHELSFKKCGHMVCMDGADCMDIMQFTGLQDKNGVDIYEGDIIKRDINCFFDNGTINELVNFSDGQFNSSDSCLNDVVSNFKAVVIGNIHENPELMEE